MTGPMIGWIPGSAVEQVAEPMIEIRGLHREYQLGGEQVGALNGVDLRIERGEYVAIIGPSGSGKSTLLHLIGGLDRPTSGHISVNGIRLDGLSDDDLARYRNRQIGFVFQSFNLQGSLTAVENVALPLLLAGQPRGTRLERASAALESLGLGDRLRHRPNQLSGGQAQRVALARALINDPTILLCDEPTGNLDSKTGLAIIEQLGELNRTRGVTTIVVTHDPRVATRAPRVISMLDGLVVEDRRQERDGTQASADSSDDR